MQKLFSLASLLALLMPSAYAETVTAVDFECYPYSDTVAVRLFTYSNCGDGHCTDEEFKDSDEYKWLQENHVYLPVSGFPETKISCKIGSSVVTAEVNGTASTWDEEITYIRITHDDMVVAEKAPLWINYRAGKDSLFSLEYRAFYKKITSLDDGETIGKIYFSELDKNSLFVEYFVRAEKGNVPITVQSITEASKAERAYILRRNKEALEKEN